MSKLLEKNKQLIGEMQRETEIERMNTEITNWVWRL